MVPTVDPLHRDHVGNWGLDLNKLGKRPLCIAKAKFQASEHSGSEERDFFLNIFQCIPMV